MYIYIFFFLFHDIFFYNKYRDYSERVNELRIQRSRTATDPFSFLSHDID